MKLTLKKDLDFKSKVLAHKIVLQSITLLGDRTEALDTEKRLYVLLSMADQICNEDVIGYCNDAEEDILTIVEKEIEPTILGLMRENKDGEHEVERFYDNCCVELFRYCQKLYDEQHSLLGFITFLLESFGNMDDETREKLVDKTNEVASKLYQDRTEKMENKANEATMKLQEIIDKYQASHPNEKIEEIKEK